MFRGDPHWLGADGAFSVDLGNGRTLWLFGDTWVDADGSGIRRNANLVRNSVAIQTGYDPSSAKIEFFWKTDSDGAAAAFFGSDSDEWYWPGHGIRLESSLVLFLNRLGPSDVGFGFESVGWAVLRVENTAQDPDHWLMRQLLTPPDSARVQVGFAGVLAHLEHLYAFGSPFVDETHPIHAARWKLNGLENGDLVGAEWWAGGKRGWIVDSLGASSQPLLTGGQSEMTVHLDEPSGAFVAIQTAGFGGADIAIRTAPALSGQWSGPNTVFVPPEASRPNVMIYAAKAHPQLEGADLVLTYATNTTEFPEHLTDSEIYYPHFVRLSYCEE